MGMSIEKAKEWLVSRKEHYEMDDNCQELAKALDIAIDTMRKYQKIRQILKDIPYGGDATVRRIQEVIEDGNDNR